MVDYNNILKKMLTEKYYSSKDLIYSTDKNILLSPYDYKGFLDFKDKLKHDSHNDFCVLLPLKSFNNHELYYVKCSQLMSNIIDFLKFAVEDYQEKNVSMNIRNVDEITRSRIYSEVEGSLNIESVPTTRKKVDGILSGRVKPKEPNEIVIQNMGSAIEFVYRCPDFNKDNLKTLYLLLSKDSLKEEDKLKENAYYRNAEVEIDHYDGCPSSQINDCMNSLFKYVNDNLGNSRTIGILPHIAHYYIVYIHPYFDFNGRTARMVSLWISLLDANRNLPLVMSEAINQTKSGYYNALRETRNTHNDLTYFLNYIYETLTSYSFVYKNLEQITIDLQNKGITWTENDKIYFKKILISYSGKFTCRDFTRWVKINVSKQGAFKILNRLANINLLNSTISNSGKKLFELNFKKIPYLLPSLKQFVK